MGEAVVAHVTHEGLTLGCALRPGPRPDRLLLFVENASESPVRIDPAAIRLTSIKLEGSSPKRKRLKILSPSQVREARSRSQPLGTTRDWPSRRDAWSAGSSLGRPPGDPGQPILHRDTGEPMKPANADLGAEEAAKPRRPERQPRTANGTYRRGDWESLMSRAQGVNLRPVAVGPRQAAAGLVHFKGKVVDRLEVIVPVGVAEYHFALDARGAR
jgi:hypothetical protein